jgi:hypothetical protein
MRLRLGNEADCLDLQHTELRSRLPCTPHAWPEPPTARAVSFLGQEQSLDHFEHRTFKWPLCTEDAPVAPSTISGARPTGDPRALLRRGRRIACVVGITSRVATVERRAVVRCKGTPVAQTVR